MVGILLAWAGGMAGAGERSGETHWAFQPLRTVTVPDPAGAAGDAGPIDRFIAAGLKPHRLTLAPKAGRRVLIRRWALDLTGLPPSPEEVREFLDDEAPEAEGRLIRRFLDSPPFGERWGRHWLDWSGYVDVLGGDNDAGTIKLGDGKWRYRDYVIRSLNEDKPFDRFLREQLAGDELVEWRTAAVFTPETVELLTATTFLRNAADDTDENELNTPDIRHGVAQRTAEVVANNLFALTLNCAKCHDHKYDPISQRDYYAFLAHFAPAFNPEAWVQPKDRALPAVSKSEKAGIEAHNRAVDEAVRALERRREEIEAPVRERLGSEKLARLPVEIRLDVKGAVETPAAKRSEVQKYLAGKFEASLRMTDDELAAALTEQDRTTIAFLNGEAARLKGTRRSWATLQAVYDTGPAPATRLLRRGDHLTPGEAVAPGLLTVLHGGATLAGGRAEPGSADGAGGSGRRLALAHEITDPRSPAAALIARVLMNRVWQQLFGVGLVATSENFGLSGGAPSHPELLEWLAGEFIRRGWRLKPMIEAIVTSAAYRQSADGSDGPGDGTGAVSADPGNRLLWRQRLRRLDAEIVRDSLLAVSGALDASMGGPPVPIESRPDGMVVVKEKDCPTPTSQWRRSVYLLARRNYQPSLLAAFDLPPMPMNCTRRTPSAVVSQSLTMLNDAFVLEQADLLAGKVERETAGRGGSERVGRAFEWVLARPPAADEAGWSLEFLDRQARRHEGAGETVEGARRKALANLCHVLLNTSEFLHTP